MSEQIAPKHPRPSLDLYPSPGRPSDPPTWEDVVRLAHTWPQAHVAVTQALQAGEGGTQG